MVWWKISDSCDVTTATTSSICLQSCTRNRRDDTALSPFPLIVHRVGISEKIGFPEHAVGANELTTGVVDGIDNRLYPSQSVRQQFRSAGRSIPIIRYIPRDVVP